MEANSNPVNQHQRNLGDVRNKQHTLPWGGGGISLCAMTGWERQHVNIKKIHKEKSSCTKRKKLKTIPKGPRVTPHSKNDTETPWLNLSLGGRGKIMAGTNRGGGGERRGGPTLLFPRPVLGKIKKKRIHSLLEFVMGVVETCRQY